MNPEKNYISAHKSLLDEVYESKLKIKLLEEELRKYGEFRATENVEVQSRLDGKMNQRKDTFADLLPPGTSLTASQISSDTTKASSSIPHVKNKVSSLVASHVMSSSPKDEISSISVFLRPDLKSQLPPPRPISYEKLYYIYPLEEEFWWRWPKNASGCDTNGNGYIGYEHSELSG